MNKLISLIILLINISVVFTFPRNNYMRCGRNGYGLVCPEGYCCSKSGYCGKSNDHCNTIFGCQRLYGECKTPKIKNQNYIVSILRNENDTNYDSVTVEVRYAIDELVNERMNDIYQLIYNNRDTYGDDEKLDELDQYLPLPENKKLKFINDKPWSISEFGKMNSDKYIPISSELVGHICPVKNYYTVYAYLSIDIVHLVENLPNVISVDMSQETLPN